MKKNRVISIILFMSMILGITGCGLKEVDYKKQSKNYACVEGVLFTAEGDVVFDKVNDKKIYSSVVGNTKAFLDEMGGLYVLDGSDALLIAENVFYVVVSNYGDYIMYIQSEDIWRDNGKGILFQYDVNDKETELVDENVLSGVILSPDGKSMVYYRQEYDDYITPCLVVNGKAKEIDIDLMEGIVITITNKAKDIYWNSRSSGLSVDNKKINSSRGNDFVFNLDNTELLYIDEEKSTHYYRLDKNKDVRLSKKEFEMNYEMYGGIERYKCEYTTLGIDTFIGTLLEIDGLYYLDKNGKKLKKIAKYYDKYKISEDGKGMLFIDDESLKYVKNIHKSLKSKLLGKDIEVYDFVASEDLKMVYYIGANGINFLKHKKGERIVSNVEDNDYVYSDKHKKLYFILKDELYCATDNKDTVELLFDEKRVDSIWNLSGNMFFVCSSGWNIWIYMITDDGEIEEIWSNQSF